MVRQTIESVLGRNERIIIQQIIPTSRVKKAIEISFEEARRMGHNYVGTEHLLLGLLIEGEGIAAHVLEDLGATLEKVRPEIERLLVSTGAEEEGLEALNYKRSAIAFWSTIPSRPIDFGNACRLLYTLQTGQVVSKMAAARWALAAFPADVAPVIEAAMAWQKAASVSATVDKTLAFIDWAQASCTSQARDWPDPVNDPPVVERTAGTVAGSLGRTWNAHSVADEIIQHPVAGKSPLAARLDGCRKLASILIYIVASPSSKTVLGN